MVQGGLVALWLPWWLLYGSEVIRCSRSLSGLMVIKLMVIGKGLQSWSAFGLL